MKAIVCVKQVPDTSGKVAVKPDGTLDRASMATITNPDDLNALEAALKLKDATGCEVVVVTMGPPPAEGMLRELLARGADRAVLISGREFGGSDTFATSQIIAAAVNKIGVGPEDIVFCGRQAIDGDTAQVGPQIAEKLHLPQVTYAADIQKDGDTVTVKASSRHCGGHTSVNQLELYDQEGRLLGDAVAYRDSRTQGMDAKLEQTMPFTELYRRTGIAKQPFNTVYQLMATPREQLDQAQDFLMIPDYLHYRLTGRKANEYTEASTTGMLNSVLADATARVQPPTDKGRRLKIYYMTQVGVKPPHFVIFCNDAKLFHFSYQRYIENQIRATFGLVGTPVRITIRQKGDKEE